MIVIYVKSVNVKQNCV